MQRTVTVTADDFGLTKSATDAILVAVDRGFVNQVSVIANGYAADYALSAWSTRAERLALSLHVNLTEGKALAPSGSLRVIAREDGTFRYSSIGLLVRSCLPWGRRALRDDLLIECEAQLAFVRERVGSAPLSVDGHQHVHMVPMVRSVIEELHARYPFRSVRIPYEPFFMPETGIGAYLGIGGVRHWGLNLLASTRRPLPHPDYFLGSLLSGAQTLPALMEGLGVVEGKRGLSVEIALHPGVSSSDEIEGWEGDRAWHTSPWRAREQALSTSAEFGNLITRFRQGSLTARYSNLGEVARFGIAGVIATLTNLGLLYAFTEFLGIWYLLSAILSYAIATGVGFTLQKFWAFDSRSLKGVHAELGIFLANNLLGVAFTVAGLFVLVEYAGLWYLLAQVITTAIIAVWNFFVYRIVFRKVSP